MGCFGGIFRKIRRLFKVESKRDFYIFHDSRYRGNKDIIKY